MTAYSFGNRWVGIVALREPDSAVPEPLHRMAARLAGANRTRPVPLGDGVITSAGDASQRIRRIGQRLAFMGQWERSDTCAGLATALEIGREVSLPEWLRGELHGNPKQARKRKKTQGEYPSMGRSQEHMEQPPSTIAVHLVEPAHVEPALPPQLPHDIKLPPTPLRMVQDLTSFGIENVSEPAVSRWLSLAALHRSALHESTELSDVVTPGLLDFLSVVGQVWLNVVVMEQAQQETDFDEAKAVANAVAVLGAHARQLVAEWVEATGEVILGRGEAAQSAVGRKGRAVFDGVGMQILGGLALTSGGPAPVAAIVSELWTPPPAAAGRDWRTDLQRHLGYDPEATTESTGPDHAKKFTVTIRDHNGTAAEGTGGSRKAAYREAARQYLQAHAPTVATAATRRAGAASPRRYPRAATSHQQAVDRLISQFSLPPDAAPWMVQALTHASWTHENRPVVARHNQRSNAVLAAQGNHVLNALAAHRRALRTVQKTLRPTADEARIQSVPGEFAADLFDDMGLERDVLLGRGLPTVPQKARLDFVQAITAVAWRFRRTDLLHAPPELWRRSLDGLAFELDASTQLQNLCSSLDVALEVDYDESGTEHSREFAARLTFSHSTGWIDMWGPWVRGSKGAAKQAAAAEVVDLVVAHAAGDVEELDAPDYELLTFLVEAELRAAPRLRSEASAFSRRRLGLDRLAGGDFAGFNQWARRTEELVGAGPPEDHEPGLGSFYTDQIRAQRWSRDGTIGETGRAVCRWIRGLAAAGDVPTPGAEWSRLNGLGAALGAMTDDQATASDLLAQFEELLRDTDARIDDRLGDARTRDLRPGVAGLAHEILAQCLSIGERWGGTPEVVVATAADGATVAIRIPGVDLGASLSVLVHLMPSLVPGFSSSADGADVVMTLPWEVDTRSVVARAGLNALTDSLRDRRLADLRTATLELIDVVAQWAAAEPSGDAREVPFRAVACVDRLEAALQGRAVRVAPRS